LNPIESNPLTRRTTAVIALATGWGVMAASPLLARLADDTALLDAIAYTGSRTFAQVHRLDVSGSANTLLIFTDHPLHAKTLAQKAATLTPPALARFVGLNLATLTSWRPSEGTTPSLLTDDRAPVAPLVLSMLWRHAMGGE
jgi:hypothetical protein